MAAMVSLTDVLSMLSDQEAQEPYVIPRPGIESIDLGHGRTKPALPSSRGDKLGIAAERNDIAKAKKMISKGADVNIRNPGSGVTPLGVAAERGHDEIVTMLLKAKADVHLMTYDGMTPLQIAAQFGRTTTIKMLIAANANVNAPHHKTALVAATSCGCLSTMAVLLEAKADVNQACAGDFDEYPLHVAVRLGFVDAVKLLLGTGLVNVLQENNLKETALEMAITRSCAPRHKEIADILRPLTEKLQTKPTLGDKPAEYAESPPDGPPMVPHDGGMPPMRPNVDPRCPPDVTPDGPPMDPSITAAERAGCSLSVGTFCTR